MANFWKEIKPPFFVLAPMEDVTDTVFRQIIASIAKPDVFFTEFANVDAVIHGDTQRLRFTEIEHPIVAQIWGTDPQKFCAAAKIVADLGFDGIDINLGCPVKDVVRQGACAALIGKQIQVGEIIKAARKGASGLPVSVKTRIGNKKIITQDWIGFLLTQGLGAITVHGRTAAEMSKVPTHWDEIAKSVELRNKLKSATLIIGNGDVQNILDAKRYALDAGVDGVMIGRGIFTNPAVFDKSGRILSPGEKLQLFARHIKLYRRTWGQQRNLNILKKFAKTYISGWSGAAVMRQRLSRAKSYDQLLTSLSGYLGVDGKQVLF